VHRFLWVDAAHTTWQRLASCTRRSPHDSVSCKSIFSSLRFSLPPFVGRPILFRRCRRVGFSFRSRMLRFPLGRMRISRRRLRFLGRRFWRRRWRRGRFWRLRTRGRFRWLCTPLRRRRIRSGPSHRSRAWLRRRLSRLGRFPWWLNRSCRPGSRPWRGWWWRARLRRGFYRLDCSPRRFARSCGAGGRSRCRWWRRTRPCRRWFWLHCFPRRFIRSCGRSSRSARG
jgi:hypothetical protein